MTGKTLADFIPAWARSEEIAVKGKAAMLSLKVEPVTSMHILKAALSQQLELLCILLMGPLILAGAKKQ